MKMKYVELQANFRVLGNTEDGLDDNYDTYRVGVNGVVLITENNKNQNSDAYDVVMDDRSVLTVWNPLWAKKVPCEEGEAVAPGFAEYSEGLAPDGPAILKDGHAMFPQDIVRDLNRKSYLEGAIAERAVRETGTIPLEIVQELWDTVAEGRGVLAWEELRDRLEAAGVNVSGEKES